MRLARVWIGLLTALGAAVLLLAAPVSALETTPSMPPKVNGPLLITGYSLQGHSLRYVQVTNTSEEVVALEGWSLSADWAGGTWQYPQTLSGLVAPNSKFTIANRLIIPSATFVFDDETIAMPPRLSTIHLLPPISSDWSEVSVSVSGSDATNTIPAIVYVTRNISATTGAYLSSFTTFTPDESFQLESDALYELPEDVDLQIVEVYPQPKDCSPAEQTPLCSEYVKLYNPSDYAINLGKFRLRSGVAGQSSSPSNTTELPMELLPANTYVSYRLGLIDSGGWVWIEDMYGLERYDSTIVSYPSSSSREGVAWSLNPRAKAWQWTPYPTPYNAENVFSQGGRINNCEGLALSEIAANNTPQFIELINRSDSVLDISGCQLQTNRSQTTSYIFADNTKLAAGGYVTVAIADTELALTKTTNGTVYLLSSDGSVEIDARSYDNLDDATSLSLVGGKWLQTFSITPGGPNEYAEYPMCEDGYIRNVKTGRCNKKAVAVSLTPCLSTQYRHPETNRCRKIATTATLAACATNQYRNPETNRCRLISNASTTLKACNEGQERNPATNRCRRTDSNLVPSADFPVETAGEGTQSSVSWLVFGSIGALAAAYAGWEWRYEIASVLRKLKGLVVKA